jgi:hypothetical protein
MSLFKKIFSSEKKETLDKGLEKSKTSFFFQNLIKQLQENPR